MKDIYDKYRNPIKTNVSIGFHIEKVKSCSIESKNTFYIKGSINEFSILNDLFNNFKDHLSEKELLNVLKNVQINNVFSEVTVNKVRDFLITGKLFFSQDAQFPTGSTRRTEKTIYFDTTICMILTHLIVQSYKKIVKKCGVAFTFILTDAQNIDRSSLKILQNLFLSLKDIKIDFIMLFREKNKSVLKIDKNDFYSRYILSRAKCFNKIFNVLVYTELTKNFDINGFIKKIDFDKYYSFYIDKLINENININLKYLDNLIYRSNYESFYISADYKHNNTKINNEEKLGIYRFCAISDAYNCLFDEAIEISNKAIKISSPEFYTFFKLYNGLIYLKKKNQYSLAITEFEDGLSACLQINDPVKQVTERGFLVNAINLHKTLLCLQNNKGKTDYTI